MPTGIWPISAAQRFLPRGPQKMNHRGTEAQKRRALEHEPLDAVLEDGRMKIEQQASWHAAELQIGQ